VLDFDSLAAREVDEAVSGNAVVLDADVAPEDADETATAITLGGTTEITTSISEGTARDTAGNLWTVRVCNGALCGWDSTASALEITPVSSDHDAYAILQAPSTGDGIPPARQLLWFDNFVGRTRNFPLT
jgi:hypothetical protein